jgi:hypothetical protein
LDSVFQFASEAPADFAAVSMVFWHMPQLPQTFTVSFFCADTDVNRKRAMILKMIFDFMI